MPYPIDDKLVIAVSSSALFDMQASDAVFRQEGEDAYRKYQQKNIDAPLEPGVAFTFVKRLLDLNTSFPKEQPIEVILFSKNSPETGLRAFRSIQHHKLNISRACFSSGTPNHQYLPAFNSTLFLTTNVEDAREALANGITAGVVGKQEIHDSNEEGLCLAFDFDGVIADDSSEKIYNEQGLEVYQEYEKVYGMHPLKSGPIAELLKRISSYQKLERAKQLEEPSYKRLLKTAIVTARNAPAHERVVFTLLSLGVEVDEVFFMGGVEKARLLNILKPHIFFDDQISHLENIKNIAGVHIPFGVANANS
ncbi:5'-nucleotidase [Porphyromonas endodontalis]|uniref:5'-nucleotidase n=1 Tax=Porphyromonas endodontalis TaxID=28124 RepID=UPI00288A1B60|nr:5'-nucleotidase [Porphyromonas endodontalis]